MSGELARVDAMPVAVPARQPTIAEMLSVAVQREITPETAGVVERLAALMERQEDREAKRQFAADFAQMQAQMPEVVASKIVPLKSGGVKFRYAPTEDIMRQAKPFLTRFGFSISLTTTRPALDRVTGVCTLIHRGGHERTSECTVRIGAGDSPSDADIGSATKAQREALCDALGIMRRPGNEEDAAIVGNGKSITEEQAMDLETRVTSAGADVQKFLAFAGAESFSSIPAANLDRVLDQLRRKEAGR
jgi:hypothetical protein